MNILVTGASGFIGTALINKLIENGHTIFSLTRDNKKKDSLLKSGVSEVVIGDLTKKESVSGFEALVNKSDLVIHLAAIPGEHDNISWSEYNLVNVQGTKNILDLSRKYNKKILFCSSISVHGEPKQKPAQENTPFSPVTPYAKSKIEAEKMVGEYKNSLIIRPGVVYGSGDLNGMVLRYCQLTKHFPGIMVGMGKNHLSLIYIDDLTKAIITLIAYQGREKVFLCVNPEDLTVEKFSRAIAKKLKTKEPKIRIPVFLIRIFALFSSFISQRNITLFTADTTFSSQRLKEATGFMPETLFEEGIEKTINWYQKNGHL